MKYEDINKPEELLDYMSNNIKYGFIGRNKKTYTNPFSDEWNDWYEQCLVQTGKQVLKSGYGTCWDQVELERLWFEEHNYEIKTIFIWFEVDHENNYPTHTFLLFKKDEKWCWFENAFEALRGIHTFNTVEEAVRYVMDKQIEYAIKNQIDVEADKDNLVAYEYNILNEQLNVDEYLNHVTKKRIS